MDEREIYQPFTRQRELLAERERQNLVKIATARPRRRGLTFTVSALGQRLYAFYRGLYNQRSVFDQAEKPPVLKSRPR